MGREARINLFLHHCVYFSYVYDENLRSSFLYISQHSKHSLTATMVVLSQLKNLKFCVKKLMEKISFLPNLVLNFMPKMPLWTHKKPSLTSLRNSSDLLKKALSICQEAIYRQQHKRPQRCPPLVRKAKANWTIGMIINQIIRNLLSWTKERGRE